MNKTDLIKESFITSDLFDLAMTHRSWVNEHPNVRGSNERLEFLGDAILEFVTSKELYIKYPDKEEGYLTALRANLVNTTSLALVAKKLNLGNLLYLSKGEEDGGGRDNTSLLADTVEALIGAIFIDAGLDKAYQFISENILTDMDKLSSTSLKDPKSSLQELVQSQGSPTPKYNVVEEIGPDHNKIFTIAVFINGEEKGRGKGKNKSEAAQEAAADALSKFS